MGCGDDRPQAHHDTHHQRFAARSYSCRSKDVLEKAVHINYEEARSITAHPTTMPDLGVELHHCSLF